MPAVLRKSRLEQTNTFRLASGTATESSQNSGDSPEPPNVDINPTNQNINSDNLDAIEYMEEEHQELQISSPNQDLNTSSVVSGLRHSARIANMNARRLQVAQNHSTNQNIEAIEAVNQNQIININVSLLYQEIIPMERQEDNIIPNDQNQTQNSGLRKSARISNMMANRKRKLEIEEPPVVKDKKIRVTKKSTVVKKKGKKSPLKKLSTTATQTEINSSDESRWRSFQFINQFWQYLQDKF